MSFSDPKVLVLGGNPGRWSASERRHEAAVTNGIEAWVFAFDGDYSCGDALSVSEIVNYDIVIGNLNAQYLDNHLTYLRSKPDAVKWVTLVEGNAAEYLKPNPKVKEILDAADLVSVINSISLDLFRSLTKTRVEYIGVPHPSEGIRALATPIEHRREEVFLSSFLSSRQTDYLVAKQLDIPMVGCEPRLSRKLKTLPALWKKYGSFDPEYRIDKVKQYYNDSALRVLPEKPFKEYFTYYGASYLWVNLDERYTWGRNILDAAALQVPVISTPSTVHQETLFPELMVSSAFAISEAVEIGKRLLNDMDFYRSVTDISLERLAPFGHSAMKEKLLNYL
ncbi:MAG TPA: hypothetical protein VFO76_13230 [Candidatus Kapabacteria bacterium]|nr:hypothetical protein [Candidatus Kapabacteria bacterium]